VFSVWVTFPEHKWVILRDRRTVHGFVPVLVIQSFLRLLYAACLYLSELPAQTKTGCKGQPPYSPARELRWFRCRSRHRAVGPRTRYELSNNNWALRTSCVLSLFRPARSASVQAQGKAQWVCSKETVEFTLSTVESWWYIFLVFL